MAVCALATMENARSIPKPAPTLGVRFSGDRERRSRTQLDGRDRGRWLQHRTLPDMQHNYTKTFTGTSAAVPQVSGVVALMLQANLSLGWRDATLFWRRRRGATMQRTPTVPSGAESGSITSMDLRRQCAGRRRGRVRLDDVGPQRQYDTPLDCPSLRFPTTTALGSATNVGAVAVSAARAY
jgi:subtilisin family serine protease